MSDMYFGLGRYGKAELIKHLNAKYVLKDKQHPTVCKIKHIYKGMQGKGFKYITIHYLSHSNVEHVVDMINIDSNPFEKYVWELLVFGDN